MSDETQALDLLPDLWSAGYTTKEQDGSWHLFAPDGEGVLHADTFRELCAAIVDWKNAEAETSERSERRMNERIDDSSPAPCYAQAIAKMHDDAARLESEGTALLVQRKLHDAHTRIDTARCLRVAANYMDGTACA